MTYATSSVYNTLFAKDGFSTMRGGMKGLLTVDTNQFIRLIGEKKGFLAKVFLNLIIQLCITYYVMMNYPASKEDKINMYFWLAFAFQVAIIFILALVPMPSFLKFILFSLFSTSMGFMLSTIKNIVPYNIIEASIMGAGSIFVTMIAVGLFLTLTGINLGLGFGLFLCFDLFFLILARNITMICVWAPVFIQGFTIMSLLLFAAFIIYDTNHILQRNYFGDFITASLDYYLDIVNIFINLISLSGGNN